MKRIWIVLPLLVASCGIITLPEQQLKDFHFINIVPADQLKPSMVGYIIENQIQFMNIPNLPYTGMNLDAALTYKGAAPFLRVQIFVASSRPNCPVIFSTKVGYGNGLLCDGPAGGNMLLEVVLNKDQVTPIHLSNSVLDKAIQDKQLYLGMRLLAGTTTPDEWIEVTQIKINGRL